MLASTPPPAHSWISPGFLAFSSNRPSSGKDEPACTCSSLLPPGCCRPRQRVVAIPAASGAVQRKVGICCLRGGSGEAVYLSKTPAGGEQADANTPMIPTATTNQGFGGVALVTERSTATGGGRGRWFYSVLPDGTLQVGRLSVSVRCRASLDVGIETSQQ